MSGFQSLRFKIAGTICGVATLVIYGVLQITLSSMTESSQANILRNGEIIMDAVNFVAEPALFNEHYTVLQEYLLRIAENDLLLEARVMDSQQKVVASSFPPAIGTLSVEFEPAANSYWITQDIPGAMESLGSIGLQFSSAPQIAAGKQARVLGTGIAVSGLLLVLIVSVIVARALTKQLETINTTAVQISNGQLYARTKLSGNDEISHLGRALDALSDRLVSQLDALSNSESKYRLLVDSAPICIHGIDAAGKIASMNPSGLKTLGVPSEDSVINTCYLDLIAAEDRPRVEELLKSAAGGVSHHFEFKSKGDMYFQSSFVPLMTSTGEAERIIGISIDITARKQLEEQQQNLYRQLELAIKNGRVSTWEWQFDTKKIHLTPPSHSSAETGESDLGFYLDDRMPGVHPEDRARFLAAIDASIAPPGSPLNVEYRYRSKDSPYIWIQTRGDLQYDEEGRATHMAGTDVDITDLKNSQQQLRLLVSRLQKVREEERTEMARELHDELGQSLTSLRIDLAWALQHLPDSDEQLSQRFQGALELVDSTVEKVQKMSFELRPAVLSDLGMAAAIEWQVQGFQRRTSCQCEVDINVAGIEANEARDIALFRIVQESLTNVARHAQASALTVTLYVEFGSLALDIIDNGVGIKATDIANPNSIGLLGMRERAVALHGQLDISPVPTGGTHIKLKLPIEPPPHLV